MFHLIPTMQMHQPGVRLRRISSWFLAFILLGPSAPVLADDVATAHAASTIRPRIGLVLSGGGARGYAHLGVLKVLEQLHIPIDYIAATSMGAVVGGLYASGLSATELESRLSKINLSDIAFDRNERAQLPQSLREDDFQYPIGLSAGYADGALKLPVGIVQGNRLFALLQNWTAQLPADIAFDQLPIPFRALATDLGSGDEVVLSRGSLPQAIRASMAVPGLFSPTEVNGRVLVDGGLVGNLPVKLVQEMGADIVIAVNIAAPLQEPSALDSPAAVTQQTLSILINQNMKAQKALLKEADILIEPDLNNLSFSDFSRAKDGILAGEKAAQQQHVKLVALALSSSQWQQYLAARQRCQVLAQDTRIDAIEITTKGRVPATIVRQQLMVREGDRYDPVALNHELNQLSTNGDFESAAQKLIHQDGRNILKVNATEKSWGRQFFLFGFGLSNNFDGRGAFNLQIGHRYPWITESGLEWRNDVLLGSNRLGWHSELRQPISHTLGLYLAPHLEYARRRLDLYNIDDAPNAKIVPVTAYQIITKSGGLDLGVPLGHLGEFRAGAYYQQTSYSPLYVLPDEDGQADKRFPKLQIQRPVASAQIVIDQLDDVLFPRKGYYLSAQATQAFGRSQNRYKKAQVKGLWAMSHGSHTLNLALEGAGAYDSPEDSPDNSNFFDNTLGGFQRLSAYAPDQFTGSYLLYGRITYLNNLQGLTLPGLRNTILGASLEIGDVWQQRENFGKGPYKKSANLFIGGNSIIGPLYFGLAAAPQGVWNVYLQLGRVF